MWFWTLPHTFHVILNLLGLTLRWSKHMPLSFSSGVWWKYPTDRAYKGGSCTSGPPWMNKFARWCYLWTVDSLGAPPDGGSAPFCEPGIICVLPPAPPGTLPNQLAELLLFFPQYSVLLDLFLCCSLLRLWFFLQIFPANIFFWREVIKNFIYTSTLVCVCTRVQRPG